MTAEIVQGPADFIRHFFNLAPLSICGSGGYYSLCLTVMRLNASVVMKHWLNKHHTCAMGTCFKNDDCYHFAMRV
jgi:hypothetical protein